MSEVAPPPRPAPPVRKATAAAAPARRRAPAAGALVVRGLRALDAELAAAIPRVIGAVDDEAIHDLRVAIRRLRTLLKLARPVFGRHHADAVRAAFTTVHRATGALRDEEVLDETLSEIASDSPSFVGWKLRRQARERSLRRGVVAQLRAGDLSRARQMLKALMTLPIDPDRDRSAAKLARRALERARRNVETLRDAPTTDAVRLHDLRIAYKELRYAAELLAPALPADLAAMAEPASKFQKRLGEIHDADVALMTLSRARGLDPAARAEAQAALEALRTKRVAKYVADMAPLASASSPDIAEPPASETRPWEVPAGGAGGQVSKVKRSAASRSGRSPAF